MRFDSDTKALGHRATLNDSFAQTNLEDWLASLLSDKQPAQVLDLGCGQGKQIFSFAERWPNASFLGIDVSPDAIAAVTATARAKHLQQVTAREANLDECLDLLRGRTFDAILSTYAIYYTKDVVGLIKGLASLLQPGGVCLVSGYGVGSNQEILDLVNEMVGVALLPPSGDFFDAGQIAQIGGAFRSTTSYRLRNEVRFPTVDSLMTWWRNHNSYRAEVAEQVSKAVAAIIEKQQTFGLAKNVLAVRFDA